MKRNTLFYVGLWIFVGMFIIFMFLRIAELNHWFGLYSDPLFQWANEFLLIPVLLMICNMDKKEEKKDDKDDKSV